MPAEIQSPGARGWACRPRSRARTARETVPETSRTVEKLAGSIAAVPSAMRQRIEFAAKQTSADNVRTSVLTAGGNGAGPAVARTPTGSPRQAAGHWKQRLYPSGSVRYSCFIP